MSRSQRLAELLWGPLGDGEVYAVLDGARDPRIVPALERGGVEHSCLYAGALAPELAEVAPYLVRLSPWAPFTAWLLEVGFGASWGVFLSSRAAPQVLRRHLRRFLLVEDPRGETLYFRYYDPRVLGVYLPTCDAGELAALFGAVQAYWVEADRARVRRFTADGARLTVDEHAL